MDAHCHLHLSQPVGRSESPSLRGEKALVNGTQKHDWQDVLSFCNLHPARFFPSLGLHPWHIPEATDHWSQNLYDLLESSGAAIGECGLDRSRNRTTPLALQQEVLITQLGMARDLKRVISLHCVGAWGTLLRCLEQIGPLPVPFLLHSIACPAEMLPAFLERNALCSVSFRSPGSLVALIPDDQLVIETDYPFGKSALSWDAQLNEQLNRLSAIKKQPLGEPSLLENLRTTPHGLASVD